MASDQQIKDDIIRIATEKHNKTGGHCGTYIKDLGYPVTKQVKEIINDLVRSRKITWHDGIHGILIKIYE